MEIANIVMYNPPFVHRGGDKNLSELCGYCVYTHLNKEYLVMVNIGSEIYRAVSRLHDDHMPVGGWNPQERISIAEALRAYTCVPAYSVFSEDKLGTLEPGKFADIVVLDRDLFELSSPEELWDTKVKLTMMDGKIIYEDKELSTMK